MGFFSIQGNIRAQDAGAADTESFSMSRGSIPETLLRPQRGEAPRYPVDTVIGPLGQGEAPREAYQFARQAAAALAAGSMDAASLAAMNRVSRESHLSMLGSISPRTYRLGSGREEADGAVSFLVRFVGREYSITGELYVRLTDQQPAPPKEAAPPADTEEGAAPPPEAPRPPARRVWVFEELLLDEARSRESEDNDTKRRFDFPPYERFF